MLDPHVAETKEDGGVTIKKKTGPLHLEMQMCVEIEVDVDLTIRVLKGDQQEELVVRTVGENLKKMKEVLHVATEKAPFEEEEMTVVLVRIEVLVEEKSVVLVEVMTVVLVETTVVLVQEMTKVLLIGGLHLGKLTEMIKPPEFLNAAMIGETEHQQETVLTIGDLDQEVAVTKNAEGHPIVDLQQKTSLLG